MDLKDEQWAILEPLIPKPHTRSDGRGRPWRHAREVLNGILWVLRTGAPWQDVPPRYPSPIDVASASPAEVKLVCSTLEARFIPELPQRLIGDKAYDSDPLAATLSDIGMELISPNRSNRKIKTQDGRPLRRYKRRWKMERLFAWLFNFRRLVTRWENDAVNFLGFVQLGCIVILLRRCL